MVGYQVIGNDVVAAKFAADLAQINAEKTFWLNDVGEIVERAIKQNISRQRLERTGALFYSGRTFNLTKNGISVGFGKGLDYAYPLEFGARAHKIYAGSSHRAVFGGQGGGIFTFAAPGGSQYLAFYWDKAGGWVYPTVVSHPGNKPYRFVYRGSLESVYPMLLYFVERLKVVFGGLSGL